MRSRPVGSVSSLRRLTSQAHSEQGRPYMSGRRNAGSRRDPLRSTLFRLGGNRDGQLLLALHVALSQLQRQCSLGETVIGGGSTEFWPWLHQPPETRAGNPQRGRGRSAPRGGQ